MEVDLGMIFIFGGNFAPAGYALCQGQLLSISQNTALFSLFGTFYGGNGINNFALPDLRGRTPIGFGQGPGLTNYIQGTTGGVENVALTTNQMPSHGHFFAVNSSAGTTGIPGPTLHLAAGPTTGSGPNASQLNTYTTSGFTTTLASDTVQSVGGDQSHINMQPYLVVNYVVALQGIFPSRN